MASSTCLQWAARNQVDVRIISDCNTVFISHMLAGARASALVSDIITNFAAYRRVTAAQVPRRHRLLPFHLRAQAQVEPAAPFGWLRAERSAPAVSRGWPPARTRSRGLRSVERVRGLKSHGAPGSLLTPAAC